MAPAKSCHVKPTVDEWKPLARGGIDEARGGHHADGHSEARVCRR